MADFPEKKVLKSTSEDVGNIDRLSSLPDCVLLHILSHFETKVAAATSVLSTRWRNLFVSLPDIGLSFCVDNDASDCDRLFSDFIHFAKRVIQQRNEASIRKIRISVKHFVKSYKLAFESWLTSAAAAMPLSNVKELSILVLIDETTMPFSIVIPPGIFTCKTLVSLSLNLGVDWIVPDFVCLPNLKELDLNKFRLVDQDSIQRFLQGCPLLELLLLCLRPSNSDSGSEEGVDVKVLDLSSPLLKKVMVCCHEEVELEFTILVKSMNLELFLGILDGQFKVTIDAPNLKSLSIHGHLLEVNIIQNLLSIDKAVVQAGFLYNVTSESDFLLRAQHAFKLISGLQNVKSLNLSQLLLKALYFSQQVLPTFKNLIKLELAPFRSPACPWICVSEVLSSLIKSSPKLEVLIFSEVFKDYFSEDEEFDSVFPDAFPLSFVEHLKEIEISDFRGEEHEFKVVEYFLKNGKSLEKMVLVTDAWGDVSEGCDRILSLKKCSADCQIVFIKTWDWFMNP